MTKPGYIGSPLLHAMYNTNWQKLIVCYCYILYLIGISTPSRGIKSELHAGKAFYVFIFLNRFQVVCGP